MSEADAYEKFCLMRWPDTGGKPVCPRCHSRGKHYAIRRLVFHCCDCGRHFSVTTDTVFSSRKLSFADLMRAFEIISTEPSIVEAAKQLGVQYKTAYVLARKIDEFSRRGINGRSQHVRYWQGGP